MISYVIKLTGHCTLWSWWSWWSWFISHSFYSNSVDLPETRFPCCTVAPHPELAWSRRSSEHRHGIKKNVGTFTCLGGQSKVGEDPNTDEDKSQILIDSVRLFVCWKCSSTGWVVTGKAELVSKNCKTELMWSSVERIYYDLLQEKMVLAFEQLSAHPSTRGKCAKKKLASWYYTFLEASKAYCI